jgi:hypothetical protein
MTLTPEIINRDLALAFGGVKYDASLPYPYQVGANAWSTPPDYFHSDALAVELLERASTDHKLPFRIDRLGPHRGCEIWPFTPKWKLGSSDESMSEAICLALHAAGVELGIIKGKYDHQTHYDQS